MTFDWDKQFLQGILRNTCILSKWVLYSSFVFEIHLFFSQSILRNTCNSSIWVMDSSFVFVTNIFFYKAFSELSGFICHHLRLGFTILAFSEVLASQLACNHSSGYQLKDFYKILRSNPLARSPGQVKLDSNKWKLWKNVFK